MSLLAFAIAAQLAVASKPTPVVLSFPEPGIDDTVAYAGYTSRFFRDVERNTLQVYLDRREGRVVHLFANGENESIGFSARTTDGAPAALHWDPASAAVARTARHRRFSHVLRSEARALELGRFVLGSMRVERDAQHFKAHRESYAAPAYIVPEFEALATQLASMPPDRQRQATATLRAPSLAALRARLTPRVGRPTPGAPGVTIEQPSLDGGDTLRVHIEPLDGATVSAPQPTLVTVRAADGRALRIRITVSTTGRPLTPLARDEIFTPDFLRWVNDMQRTADRTRARWIERQVIGVELLSSREKLMAGLPTYATYFGRDMLVSALMMQPIWRAEMSEFVIAAALRKLSPTGEVSHEEALGGQALREAASEFVALEARADTTRLAARADSLRARARDVLRTRRTTRENYHMVDDEFQLPLLIARYLDDVRVSAARKREYLLGQEAGTTRVSLIMTALHIVASRTEAYAREPKVDHLVSFAPRGREHDTASLAVQPMERWFAQSWRDSGAGYGNGRYAMDVNAIYVPHALAATSRILRALSALGIDVAVQQWRRTQRDSVSGVSRYIGQPAALTSAINTWRHAHTHFTVRMSASEVARAVAARVAAMPIEEQRYWRAFPPSGEGMEFLALALDAHGAPIAVANSDPATRLFLDGLMETAAAEGDARRSLRRDVSLFAREYPEGLLLPGIGAVVANDAYAAPLVWDAFLSDAYHGPRVVWGREVNLFLLGVASHLQRQPLDSGTAELLQTAAARVRDAVAASGFHSELWSYGFMNGRPQPVRYGSGADVQLWSTTDLAVQYVWSRLPQ